MVHDEAPALPPLGRSTTRSDLVAASIKSAILSGRLQPDELLVEVRVPKHSGWGAHYEKFSPVAQAWSIVAVAATVRVEGGLVQEAKVALTNMGLVPLRAATVEQALVGREATAEVIREAATLAADGTSPMSDANADEEYRRHLATVLTGRALVAAAGA